MGLQGRLRAEQMLPLLAAMLLAALALAVGSAAPTLEGSSEAATTTAESSYGKLPLGFAPGGTGFTASTAAGSVLLREGGATVIPTVGSRAGTPVEITPAGGADSTPRAMERLPGVVNDLRGSDPSGWRTDVPTFARVRYDDVYPGVAMDYHGTSGTLEYDFRLDPGADPTRIAVDYHGAALRLAPNGALVVGEGADRMRQAPPVAFQPAAGGHEPVRARYAIHGDRAGFVLGDYDRSRPLVIDPLFLSYSTFLGGAKSSPGSSDGDDGLTDIAIDGDGNAYVSGFSSSPAFPTTVGAYDRTRLDEQEYYADAVVSKLNPTGTALVYSTYIGGFYSDTARGIAVDGSGNAYVTGQTNSTRTDGSTRFPTTAGAYVSSGNDGSGDVFVAKLNATGSDLVYSSVFGGTGTDQGHGIAIDATGSAYVAGATGNTFPTTGGALQTVYGGNSADAFVTKLNAAGTAPAYSTYLGGNGQDEIDGIDIDSQGRAYVTGFSTAFSGNNFPTTAANRFKAVDVNSADAFLSRISANGSSLEYSTGLGADGNGGNDGSDYASAVAVGPTDGIAYITGTSSKPGATGAADFDLKNEYEGRNGQCCFGNDLFVSKFDTNATGSASLVYSTLIGGSGTETGQAIAVDSSGNAYIGGTTGNASGEKYDTTADELGGGTGRGTGIVTKVSQTGSANATLAFSTTIPNGGFGGDEVSGIAVNDSTGDVYVSGVSKGNAPLGTTAGAFQASHSGGWDGFIAKISPGTPPPDTTPPVTTITNGPAGGSTVTSAQVSFAFSSNEAGSAFECSYDSAPFAPCSSPGPGLNGSDTRSLANGLHTFAVRARDASNNVDASPDARTFTVNVTTPPPPDRTPPQTTITKAPPKVVKSRKLPVPVSVSFASNESGSTFLCRVDGGGAQGCASPAKFSLAKGPHTISVAARDRAGNVDASPATVQVTVKKKKPRKKHHNRGHREG